MQQCQIQFEGKQKRQQQQRNAGSTAGLTNANLKKLVRKRCQDQKDQNKIRNKNEGENLVGMVHQLVLQVRIRKVRSQRQGQ